MADDEGFLRRWSRRKHEARHGHEPDSDTSPIPQPEAPGAEAPVRQAALRTDDARRPVAAAGERPGPAAAEPDRPVPLESLPDIASLGAESDFRAFMRPGVPPELRRQALRKLWRVKPLVGNPERLVEYDEDYTDAARVTKGLKTLYRVGRGVLTDEEMAALDADRGQPPAAEDSDASATEGEGAAAAAATGGPTAPAADGESGATGDEAARRPSAAAPDATG